MPAGGRMDRISGMIGYRMTPWCGLSIQVGRWWYRFLRSDIQTEADVRARHLGHDGLL